MEGIHGTDEVLGKVRRVRAGHDLVGQGKAGMAWQGAARSGPAERGAAWCGKAGEDSRGKAGHVPAQSGAGKAGLVWQGAVWNGVARHDWAGKRRLTNDYG
jgi:hypothetical protein